MGPKQFITSIHTIIETLSGAKKIVERFQQNLAFFVESKKNGEMTWSEFISLLLFLQFWQN